MMHRCRFIGLCLQNWIMSNDLKKYLALLIAFVGLAGIPPMELLAADKPPNIILIIVDDMGFADAGCYDSTAIKTPNIDRLAAEGMRFLQAYSGCTVCAPARSTLMTGMHMGHASVRGNSGGISLLDEDVTLAEVLKKSGYQCGGFGKWGLGDIGTPGAAEKQGFDTFFGYYHQIHAHNFYPSYLISDGAHFPLPGNAGMSAKERRGPLVAARSSDGAERQFSAELIFERMKQFIRDHKDGPFFCFAPWTPPHATYHLPENEPAWQLYKDQPWGNRAKAHATFVSMTDRYLGETRKLLKELGIENDTLVVFCSDNGAAERFEGSLDSSGKLTGFKRSMHEGGIRVPMIYHWPGRGQAGTTSALPTYFPDFMPTLAEFAGATENVPANIDGMSIVPELTGKGDQPQHSHLYWEWPTYNWRERSYEGMMQAVRKGDMKMLRHGTKQPWKLFDLSKDEAEQHDLASQLPEQVRELEAWIAQNRTEPRPQVEPKHPAGKRFN